MNIQESIKDLFHKQLLSALHRIKLEDAFLAMIHVVVLIALAWGMSWLLKRIVTSMVRKNANHDAHVESDKRLETMLRLIRQSLNLIIWGVAGLMSLKEFGLDVRPILASAGVLGLAVGFGAQNLVRDIISGLFMILENQVRVGDIAEMNGMKGTVERLSLRTIALRDQQGVVHIIPNGAITNVSNHTLQWSAYVFELGVSYNESTDRVIEVIHKVIVDLRSDELYGSKMLTGEEIWGVDRFRDSDICIRGRLRTLPGLHQEVGREFLRRIKIAFDESNIEIPYPQRTIHIQNHSTV